ncbi:MAG: hypothetical protein ACK5JR_12565 [Tropicimonas sp.]|uniref:hypothetical protein n=1 Tax=Tropicimonas sp. TaxID=2067044 RepID=UPI003A8BE466
MLKINYAAVAAVAVSVLMPGLSGAQEYQWKFQSSDPAGNPNYILEQEWAERVRDASGGRIEIDVLPVGSIVEYNETQDAVAAGILDGHMTDPSYFTGCQRRSKSRPRGGAKAGHFLARLSPPGGRSPSGGLKRASRFFYGVCPALRARLCASL